MLRTFAALAVGLALAGPVPAQEPRQVTVTGAAEVDAVPDLATVTAGVENRAATAAAALAANSQAMTAVYGALEQAGIARRDLQTSQLGLDPVYGPYTEGAEEPQKVVGYQASNMVTVRVREVAKLGTVIDALTAAGANRLYGIGFEVSDPRPQLDAARERAVADARAKAELYARAAGVALGAVQSIRESVQPPPGPVLMRAEAMDAAPPVSEGTVTLSTQVEIVYSIE
jgi:uncharacterized protein YggE